MLLLTTSLAVLFYQLHKLKPLLNEQAQIFRKERCQVLTMLCIFDLSCVLRGLFDRSISQQIKNGHYSFGLLLAIIYSAVILDLLPICMVLLYHSKNFHTISQTTHSMDRNAQLMAYAGDSDSE